MLLYLGICFLLQVWEVFNHDFIKYILYAFFLSLLLGNPKTQMLVQLIMSQRSLILFSFFFFLSFPFCSSAWAISIILSSGLLMHCSMSRNLLLMRSRVFFISVIAFFNSDWFFPVFSSSLLKFFLCSSILFSSLAFLLLFLWILCQVNYLSVSLALFVVCCFI